jgi:uncharacterized protein (DUF433 family)
MDLTAPAYTMPMAAKYIRMPYSTLSSWVRGHARKAGERSEPIIPPAREHPRVRLSFTNLVEAHMLSIIRKDHEVPFQRVRRAIERLEQDLGVAHPLAHQSLFSSGGDLFMERLGEFINLSNPEAKATAEAIFRRVDHNERGQATRLYPALRKGLPIEAQPRVVYIDPRVSFGRPVVRRTGVPIEELLERFHAGEEPESIATDFAIDILDVNEVIRGHSELAAA